MLRSSLHRAGVALAATTLTAAVYGRAVDSPFVSVYVAITVVLALIIVVIDRILPLPGAALWLLVGAAVLNLAGGIVMVQGQPLYVFHLVGDLRFDKPAHAVSTGLAALAAYAVIARHTTSDRRSFLVALAVLVAAGLGSLVEIVEFVGSQVVPNSNVGDYGDNILDLVANLAGAIAAVPFMRRVSSPPGDAPPSP